MLANTPRVRPNWRHQGGKRTRLEAPDFDSDGRGLPDRHNWRRYGLSPSPACRAGSGGCELKHGDAAEVVAMGVCNSASHLAISILRTYQYWFTENARDWPRRHADDKPNQRRVRTTSVLPPGDMLELCCTAPDTALRVLYRRRRWRSWARINAVAAGDEVLHGTQFPAEVHRNNIFIAEHGSWNRHQYQGARTARDRRSRRPSAPAAGSVRSRLDRRST